MPSGNKNLEGLFKYIGAGNNIISETLSLHDEIIDSTESTIPRIVGNKDGLTYEIFKLNDMKELTTGNKTDCCFTVLGNGYFCLKHAMTSKNGKILEKKV